MGTIADKLGALARTKTDIRGAIMEKEQAVGEDTVECGAVTDGAFVAQNVQSFASREKCELELAADDYGDRSKNGMKQAIVELFESLIAMPQGKAGITLTNNPGVTDLTEGEKAIATGKGWMLGL